MANRLSSFFKRNERDDRNDPPAALQTEALTLLQVSNLGRQRKLLPAWFMGLLDETSHLMTDVWSSRWGSSSTPGAARGRQSPSGFTQTLFVSHGRSALCRRSNGEKAPALSWRHSWEDLELNQDTNHPVKTRNSLFITVCDGLRCGSSAHVLFHWLPLGKDSDEGVCVLIYRHSAS